MHALSPFAEKLTLLADLLLRVTRGGWIVFRPTRVCVVLATSRYIDWLLRTQNALGLRDPRIIRLHSYEGAATSHALRVHMRVPLIHAVVGEGTFQPAYEGIPPGGSSLVTLGTLSAAPPFFLGKGCFSIRASHRTEVTKGIATGHRRVMDCPICLRDAKDATPPTYRGLVLECPRCGLYRVTQDAVAALRTLKVDERLMALRKAKMLLGSRTPTITSGCLGVTLPRKRSRSAPPSNTPPATERYFRLQASSHSLVVRFTLTSSLRRLSKSGM